MTGALIFTVRALVLKCVGEVLALNMIPDIGPILVTAIEANGALIKTSMFISLYVLQ